MLGNKDFQKPLSDVYKKLFVEQPTMLNKCRDMWRYVVSTTDRVIQFKILHRVYYTPARIPGIYGTNAAECWLCTTNHADFDHIFWQCQLIQEFWKGVTRTIQKLLSVPIPVTVSVCLLGLVEELVPRRAQRTMISISLFYARKAILLCWKNPEPPTVSFWRNLIKKVLPFYKATYLSRGCPKIWKSLAMLTWC